MPNSPLVILTVDQIASLIGQAVAPLVEQIEQLQHRVGYQKHTYTLKEVALHLGYSTKTVTGFIVEGRKGRLGKIVRLEASEITPGTYRVTHAALEAFIQAFSQKYS